MMIFDSAAPMRIVLSFLVASHETLLAYLLGSNREKENEKRWQEKDIN